jgi:hypothetical protein
VTALGTRGGSWSASEWPLYDLNLPYTYASCTSEIGRWLSINGDRQMTALKLTSRSLETGE